MGKIWDSMGKHLKRTLLMDQILRLVISSEDKEALQKYAWQEGMSMSLVARRAIRKYLKDQELPPIIQDIEEKYHVEKVKSRR